LTGLIDTVKDLVTSVIVKGVLWLIGVLSFSYGIFLMAEGSELLGFTSFIFGIVLLAGLKSRGK